MYFLGMGEGGVDLCEVVLCGRFLTLLRKYVILRCLFNTSLVHTLPSNFYQISTTIMYIDTSHLLINLEEVTLIAGRAAAYEF